jgi:hypothetical protein
MKTALHALALCGIAAAAHAQSTGTISFNAPTQVLVGDTFTVEVVASGDQPLAIVGFNLEIGTTSRAEIVSGPVGNASIFQFNTFDVGSDGFQASGGSNVFGNQALPSGVVLFTFQARLLEPIPLPFLDLGIFARAGSIDAIPALSYGEATPFFLLPQAYDTVIYSNIPAPTAAAPLALAGLFAARRRR